MVKIKENKFLLSLIFKFLKIKDIIEFKKRTLSKALYLLPGYVHGFAGVIVPVLFIIYNHFLKLF